MAVQREQLHPGLPGIRESIDYFLDRPEVTMRAVQSRQGLTIARFGLRSYTPPSFPSIAGQEIHKTGLLALLTGGRFSLQVAHYSAVPVFGGVLNRSYFGIRTAQESDDAVMLTTLESGSWLPRQENGNQPQDVFSRALGVEVANVAHKLIIPKKRYGGTSVHLNSSQRAGLVDLAENMHAEQGVPEQSVLDALILKMGESQEPTPAEEEKLLVKMERALSQIELYLE
jgi:hypothetical protein